MSNEEALLEALQFAAFMLLAPYAVGIPLAVVWALLAWPIERLARFLFRSTGAPSC